MADKLDRIGFYSQNAALLADQYAAMDRRKVHAASLYLLDSPEPLRVLDVGCGSGDDARWVATEFGHQVLAAEPSDLILEALARNRHPKVEYVRDCLPDLPLITARKERFDLVLCSAVLQELGVEEREQSLQTLVAFTKPGGAVLISYPSPPSREGQHTIPDNEVADLLKTRGARLEKSWSQPDVTGRLALNGGLLSFQLRIVRVDLPCVLFA